MRDFAALAVLFGGSGLIYLWLGPPGLAGAFIMISVVFVTLGLSTGYWFGRDPQADMMLRELMRRLREFRRQ